MKKELSSPLPGEIARLDPVWQDVWRSLPPLCGYAEICRLFHFKNGKTASGVLCSDPDSPRAIRLGRQALFDRSALVVWAANRSRNARRRGCKAKA